MSKFKKSFLISILFVCGISFLAISVNTKAEEVKPDLVISYLSVEDYSSDSYRVSYAIKNIGGGNVTGGVSCGYYVNDNNVGYGSVQCLLESEVLGVNEENQGIIIFSKSLSSNYESLTMVVDSKYITSTQISTSVEEENENNNILEVNFGDGSKPDLALTGDVNITIGYSSVNYKLGVDNVDFNVGDLINISPSYINQGGNYSVYDEANPFLSKLDIVKDKKSYYSNELVANSGGGAGLWGWEPTEVGVYTLVFYIDSTYIIDESDEDNNVLEKTITIGSETEYLPDLAFIESNFKYYISEGGDGFSEGTKLVYIEVEDKNKIEKFTHGFFSFQASMNGITEIFAPKVVSDYVLGFTINLGFFGTINDDQQYSINFNIDVGDIINESNENNNTLTKTITIKEDNNNDDDGSGDDNNDNNDDSDNDNNTTTNHIILKLQRRITVLERQVIELETRLTTLDQTFADRYAGTMFLDVENHGRLWYVDPESKNRFYFENGEAALSIGAKLATGITYEDLQKIPVGVPDRLYNLKDSDGDGLPDRLESALGSDPNNADTDGDGYSDKDELLNGYNPTSNQKYSYLQSLIDRLEGKMLLQVSGPHSHGEIWYIHDGKRWYGGTQDSMYEIMKARSLGAVASDIRKIVVGEVEGIE